ncbi:zinc-dependent peptidase [Aureisphaera galaxeae]|uniref:zinc-dependent peptidase n=1 Tax=Aureisphaera galaxeae TaxID=1538023 RepID=UPI002350C299|nr:zinc-dependent peptidase [Aureisphaera galaxeae]MDC8003224.1 zinc-dependent peptidase [Aureisphaera galaxeae]
MLLLQAEENAPWLAPYAYAIVLLGFVFFLFRVFENWYANAYDRPLYRNYFVFRKLKPDLEAILESEFSFYNLLSKKEKRQFQHRVAVFMREKNFIGRDNVVVTDRMKVLIAAVGCMLSFGRKNFDYGLIEHILVYPGEFYSTMNDAMHKGEFNPKGKALVLSWEDFEKGYKIPNDNRNLGIHEFMHAMQLEARKSRDLDSTRFAKQFQNILRRLTQKEVKDKLDETQYFRSYAFTNQYEFMAVLSEYFIESPQEFKTHFPQLYKYTQKLLNFRFAGY